MTAHNLAPGYYLLDHTTGDVIGGPHGTRNQAAFHHRNEVRPGAFVILEVVGDVVPWLGSAVGNVCVDEETAEAIDAAAYCDGMEAGIAVGRKLRGPVVDLCSGGVPPLEVNPPPSYSDRIENGDGDCETPADEG